MSLNWFKVKIENVKLKIIQHFGIKNLLYNLMYLFKMNFIFTIELDEIHFGMRNPKRIKLNILNTMISWVICLLPFPFLTSEYVFSFIKSPFLPDDFNVLIIAITIFMIHCSMVKTDLLFAEIKYNLDQFKIIYLIAKDIKSKHKLTQKNYNQLTNILRISTVMLFYYGIPILSLTGILIQIIFLIKTKRFIWLITTIFIIPFYINGYICMSACGLILVFLVSYYKMRFDQLHDEVESIIPNGKVITKRKEKIILDLINQHNQVAVDIHKLNLMLRKAIASAFINFSLMKIILLYMMINTNDLLFKILAVNGFTLYLLYGIALTYSLSRQINSAHQSLEFIESVVCKYKMRLTLRLKVKLSVPMHSIPE